jgi:hypothetical protein
MIVSEIPLIYSETNGRCLRFALKREGTVERIERKIASDERSGLNNAHFEWSSLDHSVGCSSVSPLGDDDFIATLWSSRELVVSVILAQESEVKRVELDLKGLQDSAASDATSIAKVQAFENNDMIQLSIVDSGANIYTLTLEMENLTPKSRFKTLDLSQLLQEDLDLEYSGAELFDTLIHFISADLVIVALSPHILTVQINSRSLSLWSLSHVHQLMNSQSLTSILSRAGNMLLGRESDQNSVLASTTALAVSANMAWTLHTDGTVLLWHIGSNGMPHQVALVQVELPPPDQWVTHTMPFSFHLEARKEMAVLHIQTRLQGSVLYNLSIYGESYPLDLPQGTVVSTLHLSSKPQLTLVTTTQKNHQTLVWTFDSTSTTTLAIQPTSVRLTGLDDAHRLDSVQDEKTCLCFLTAFSEYAIFQATRKLVPHYVWNIVQSWAVNTLRALELWRKNKEDPQRFKALARTVLELEEQDRRPLRLTSLPQGLLLVRANGASLMRIQSETEDYEFRHLDDLALNLVSTLERTKMAELVRMETTLTNLITSLSLVLGEDGSSGDLQSDFHYLLLSVDKRPILKMTASQLQVYLESAPMSLLLPESTAAAEGIGRSASADQRRAAATLVHGGVETMRRLALGRCLISMSLANNLDTGFARYLQILATKWVMYQQVPMPPPASLKDSSPLAKRLSFGEEDTSAISVLSGGHNQKTTILDVHLMQASRFLPSSVPLDQCILSMARSVLDLSFRRPCESGTQYELLPELGCLPKPSKGEIASDYPRLALRLLSVNIFFPPPYDSPNAILARTEATAECLLIESNENPSSQVLRDRANHLLDPQVMTDDLNVTTIGEMYERMLSASKEILLGTDILDAEHAMKAQVQEILYGGPTGEIRQDIRRLCEKETLRKVLMPFFLSKGSLPALDPSQQVSFKMLLRALLRMSNLMNRLSIIERRTDRLGRVGTADNPLNLVAQTQRTIEQVEALFPKKMYDSMPEYITLWSLLYRHAEAAQEWTAALGACRSNPCHEHHLRNVKQLVKGMIDAGALGELLDLCSTVTGKEAVDLYDIAADALSRANLWGSRYAIGSRTADYLGCLYCLHLSHSDWKQAAQAMDLRLGEASQCLRGDTSSNNDILAVRDMTLSAIASSISLQLVDDKSARFLVSGESGPYPEIAFLEDAEPELAPRSILKRNLDRQSKDNQSSPIRPKDDRLSRFMTTSDLVARAVRAVAFEALFLDSAATPFPTAVLAKPYPHIDLAVIDNLASSGYYPLAFAVAHSMKQYSSERRGGSPRGRDRLLDSYRHVVCNYLFEVANQNELVASPHDVEMESSSSSDKRPTLSQLRYALAEAQHKGSSPMTPYVSGPKYGSRKLWPQVSAASSAMELIRMIVDRRDTSASPIALEVAEFFLSKSVARLPQWLEDHLGGVDSIIGGLFGKSRNSTSRHNPSALCTLYTKKGRYVEACDLVTRVLVGPEGGKVRRSNAASRVPEKGNIDFVPYPKIDLLWNLIDQSLRQGDIDEETMSQLRVSRLKMEQALEFHFSLLKISEEGLTSARALARGKQ